MKIAKLLEKNVYCEKLNIGVVKDAFVNMEELKVTHLELELTKEASKEILGVTPALFKLPRNTLAISALADASKCCDENGINLQVSKGQLALYLRPL